MSPILIAIIGSVLGLLVFAILALRTMHEELANLDRLVRARNDLSRHKARTRSGNKLRATPKIAKAKSPRSKHV